jgi:tRNA (guanine37-N1)-methyltransferase
VRVDLVTIFPEFFGPALDSGMLRVAREQGALETRVVNLRDFTEDRHRTTDDAPFGGGPGMVLLAGPIYRAVEAVAPQRVRGEGPGQEARIVLLTPQGVPLTQGAVRRLSRETHLVLVCGRYKGVDERVAAHLADEEISVGDFVMSGGEPAALCLLDAVTRLLPGVLGDFDSAESDSFQSGLLDCAYYTRPAEFRGHKVPEVLLSGDHGRIARFRREDAVRRTWERRPDLLRRADLSEEDRRFVERLERERERERGVSRS